MTPRDDRLAGILSRLKAELLALDVRPPSGGIADDMTLFEGGLGLDSFAVVDLIGRIERTFGFELPEEELRPESFADVLTLARVIARHAPR